MTRPACNAIKEVYNMPLHMIRGDITTVHCDAIVNAANSSLLGGGGVDGAIHRAAGPKLLEECRTLGGCQTGEAKITKGYQLPCRYVIHTVGPVWQGGNAGEPELLAACYRNSLQLAAAHGCETVAFPLISAGVYGYPRKAAQHLAIRTIAEFLADHEMSVLLVLFGSQERNSGHPEMDRWIASQLQQNAFLSAPAPAAAAPAAMPAQKKQRKSLFGRRSEAAHLSQPVCFAEEESTALSDSEAMPSTLRSILQSPDESFSQMLLRKIDESGMTDVQCYKKANIDRKLFSKIRSDMHYQPKKVTVLAFAIALELPLSETNDMLQKAGYALSHSTPFDLIVEYYIRKGNYNVYEINEALFEYDQLLIGA